MKTVLKALILIFIASPALAQDSAPVYDPVKEIMEGRNKSKGMQGASWNNSKKEKKKPAETSENKENSENPLWNKYKEADANTDEKQHAPAPEDPTEEQQANENAAEPEEKVTEKPKTGLAGILEKYKNSQQNKGGMSSRSFGNLDR